jgi:hypothetical protein
MLTQRGRHTTSLCGNLTRFNWEREHCKPAITRSSMERSLRYAPVITVQAAWPSSNKTVLLWVPYRISLIPPTNYSHIGTSGSLRWWWGSKPSRARVASIGKHLQAFRSIYYIFSIKYPRGQHCLIRQNHYDLSKRRYVYLRAIFMPLEELITARLYAYHNRRSLNQFPDELPQIVSYLLRNTPTYWYFKSFAAVTSHKYQYTATGGYKVAANLRCH